MSASAQASNSSSGTSVQQLLKELHRLITQIQDERNRSAHNLSNINKTHEKMKHESKVSSYFKNKLKSLYNTAIADARGEVDLIQQAMEKITEVKLLRNDKRLGSARQAYTQEEPRKGMRRGVLMSMLQQAAVTLPVWSGRSGESAPPLCGSVAADSGHVCDPGDHVAARVRGADGEEQWILAEVASYTSNTQKYDVDDIDYTEEEGKASQERHHLSKRRVIPLPLWKANPESNPEAVFQPNQKTPQCLKDDHIKASQTIELNVSLPRAVLLVMALYPQTTCFYRALIHEPPAKAEDDYSVLFEDTSYADGYSPPLNVAQRYVVQVKKR